MSHLVDRLMTRCGRGTDGGGGGGLGGRAVWVARLESMGRRECSRQGIESSGVRGGDGLGVRG